LETACRPKCRVSGTKVGATLAMRKSRTSVTFSA